MAETVVLSEQRGVKTVERSFSISQKRFCQNYYALLVGRQTSRTNDSSPLQRGSIGKMRYVSDESKNEQRQASFVWLVLFTQNPLEKRRRRAGKRCPLP